MQVRVRHLIFGAPARGWGCHSTHICAEFLKKYQTLYYYHFWMRHAFLRLVTPKWRLWLGIYRNNIWKAFHLQKCKVQSLKEVENGGRKPPYPAPFLVADVYKAHDLAPPYITDLFQVKTKPCEFRSSKLLIQTKFQNKTHGYRSLRYEGARLWNALPNSCQTAKNVNSFKHMIVDFI